MNRQEEYELKVKSFVKLYLNRPMNDKGQPISNGECAFQAGWPRNKCYQVASDLLKKPEIMRQVKSVEDTQKTEMTTGQDSIESIVETNLPLALQSMVKNMDDPKIAKQFAEWSYKFQRGKEAQLGEYDGASIGEIVRDLDQEIKTAEGLKQRLVEAIRSGEMQE